MKKYFAIFQAALVNSLAYPTELLARSVMIVMFMWIFFQLWRTTFTAAGAETINGLTLRDTLWYLMLAETIEMGRPRLTRAIAEQVKDGSIAYLLNKPYNFILYQLSNGLGESLFRMVANALLGGALVWLLVGPPPPLQNWLVAIVAVAGAWLLHFCVMALIGLAAFVAEEVAPFEWIYQKMTFVLGGIIIPLDFYPGWLQAIARATPFAYMAYGPARLLVAPDAQTFSSIISGQLIWLVILASVLAAAYARGVRQLAVNGG
jgi:ABC-2 type transport system permease protein